MALLQSKKEALGKGEKAPKFTLENYDGKRVSLSNFKRKPVLIIFMCNHCPYVKPKFEEIAGLQNQYEGKVEVIGINSNDQEMYPEDDVEHMKKIAKEYGYKYYLIDDTQEVARLYGAVCTPDPYLFDKDHKLVFHGRINDAMEPGEVPDKHDIRENIDKLLAGEEITSWFQPSQGCSIKWKA